MFFVEHIDFHFFSCLCFALPFFGQAAVATEFNSRSTKICFQWKISWASILACLSRQNLSSSSTSPCLMSDGSLIVIVNGRYSGLMKNAWFLETARNSTAADALPVAN